MNSQGAEILDRLMLIADLINKDMAASFAGTGLNMARVHLLWLLHHDGASTQQALARTLGVSPANITGLVDGLERNGYAERRPHPTDRRATLVTLTERGTETTSVMVRGRAEFGSRLVEGLDAEQLRWLHTGLDAVAERLDELTRSRRDTQEGP